MRVHRLDSIVLVGSHALLIENSHLHIELPLLLLEDIVNGVVFHEIRGM